MKEKKAIEPIGWGTIKEGWFDMLLFVIIIGSIFIFHPPICVVMILMAVLVLLKQVWHKKFTIKGYAVSMLVLYMLLGGVGLLYYFVGGLWAIIISHVLFCGMIIYSNRDFIKQADRQIKDQLDFIHDKRRGKL